MLEELENFNWRKEYRSRRYLIWAALSVILGLGVILLIVVPQVNQLFNLYSQVQASREQLSGLQKKLATLEQIGNLPIYAQKDRIDQVMPAQKPVFELMAGVQTAVTQNDVQLTEIRLSPGLISQEKQKIEQAVGQPVSDLGVDASPEALPPGANPPPQNNPTPPGGVFSGPDGLGKPQRDVDTFSVELTVEGSLANLNKFLNMIDLLAPLTSITSTELSIKDKGVVDKFNQDTQFSAIVKLETYYFTKVISTAVDAPLPESGGQEALVLSELGVFITPNLNQANAVVGGGLEDLFGVEGFRELTEVAQQEKEVVVPDAVLNIYNQDLQQNDINQGEAIP